MGAMVCMCTCAFCREVSVPVVAVFTASMVNVTTPFPSLSVSMSVCSLSTAAPDLMYTVPCVCGDPLLCV